MHSTGKLLLVIAAVLAVIGLLMVSGKAQPLFDFLSRRLGRLPGDIRIERENFSFYFPLMTAILLSGVLTLLFWLFRR